MYLTVTSFMFDPSFCELCCFSETKKHHDYKYNVDFLVSQIAHSSTNTLFLGLSGQLYAVGSNKYHQILDEDVSGTSLVPVSWASKMVIQEIGCGIELIVLLTDDGLVLRGIENKDVHMEEKCHSLFAIRSDYAFVKGEDVVLVGSVGKELQHVKISESVSQVVVTRCCAVALCKSGNVFGIESDGITLFKISSGIVKISGSDMALAMIDRENRVTVKDLAFHIDIPTKSYRSQVSTPVVDAMLLDDVVLCRTESNKLLMAQSHGSLLTDCNFDKSAHKLLQSDSGVVVVSSMLCEDPSRENSVTLRDAHAKKGALCSVQLGDDVWIKDAEFTVTSFGDTSVTLEGSRTVRIAAISEDDVSEQIDKLVRNGHILEKHVVDEQEIFVDSDPDFCVSYGYEPGDLIWHESRGIVEFIGMHNKELVCLDISKRLLFLSESLQFQVLKRVSKRLPHTRWVSNIDGSLIEVDISADGPKPFLPTDRVRSPFGEATVIGFRDAVYIQTYTMKMQGYEAVSVSCQELTLIRRISAPAKRCFVINGKMETVSLSTEDSVCGTLPGDKVKVDWGTYGSVVGFLNDQIVVRDQTGNLSILSKTVPEIIYRSDLMAIRFCDLLEPIFVGSPSLPVSALMPGDIVILKDVGEVEFMGTTQTNSVFRTSAGQFHYSTFAPLLCSELFTLVSRPACATPT